MDFFAIILTGILSFFSTSIMLYISLATPIGPWIAPTLVLLGLFITKIFKIPWQQLPRTVALATIASSVGGITATAFGFSFPTLFFLNESLFYSIVETPFTCVITMFFLSLTASCFAYGVVNIKDKILLVDQQLTFPVGQLTYKLIHSTNTIKKTYQLGVGSVCVFLFSCLQGGFLRYEGFIHKTYSIFSPFALGFIQLPGVQIRSDTLPMLLAIGFITGYVIALPLALGMFVKIAIVDLINNLFFPSLRNEYFLLAFCSGLVLIGMIQSFIELFYSLRRFRWSAINSQFESSKNTVKKSNVIEIILIGISILLFFSWFKFSVMSQFFLIIGSYLCISTILIIAGKMGIAPLGRFATFVMMPALLLFGADPLKVTFIATFVEVCCGVAVDLMFGRKVGQLTNLEEHIVKRFQLLGIILSSCFIGIIFWFLVHHFGIGNDIFAVQRAQARALLLQINQFNWLVLCLGAVFGLIMKKFRINAILMLGGLLMAPQISIPLIIGGLIAVIVQDRERWEPFWSGVFAANTIIELIKAIFS